jgi:cold shock CspA family protein/ribosome-associated translation inhibitor RaiA
MPFPLQVTFKDMDPSPALEARIREKADWLERFKQGILRCHVTVTAPHRHHRQGRLYSVHVEIVAPDGDMVATRGRPQDHAHEDAFVAVRDAFDAVRRQLEDHAREAGGQVKRHAPQQVGHVVRFIAGEDYGFIQTTEGEEVYFHRNSVAGDNFDKLKVGDGVHLTIDDGDNGPQASSVYPAGKGHATS